MNTNTVLCFLGLDALTYTWLEAKCIFAIADAINHHNEQIRQKAGEDFKGRLRRNKDESEDESGNEGDKESEVETVTKTISKS